MRYSTLVFLSLSGCGGSVLDVPDASFDGGLDADATITPDVQSDTGSPCGKSEVLCGTTCYPNDVNHCGPSCGVCGNPALGKATCDGTTCGFTCTFLQCGSTCVDQSSDSHNCGICAHDCLGTSCMGGMCEPQSLYLGHMATRIVVDATNVYWSEAASTHSIFQGPKGGGVTPITLSSSNAGAPIFVDATTVYFEASSGYIEWVAIGGGSVNGVPTSSAMTGNLLIGTQRAYFAYGYGAGTFAAIGLDGGAATTIAGTPTIIDWFDIHSGQPYLSWRWVNYTSAFGTTTVDGGVTPIALLDAGVVQSIAFDSNNAYLAGQGVLYQTPLDGGATTPLESGVGIAQVLADGSWIYWLDNTGSSAGIYRIPIGGGTKTTIVSYGSGASVSCMAIDATYIYYGLFSGTSGLYRIAK